MMARAAGLRWRSTHPIHPPVRQGSSIAQRVQRRYARAALHVELRVRRLARRLRRRLAWGRTYRLTSYLRSALWTVPLVAIGLVLLLVPPLRWLDDWLHWDWSALAPAGAEALFQTVITLTLSFLVFTFGSLLVAIQVASGQLTPRIIATILLRNDVVRYSVGLFVFTLVFAVMALNRHDATVSQLVAFLTAILGIACIADFLFLIDYAARLLRPVSVVAHVGNAAVDVIDGMYPEPTNEDGADTAPAASFAPARVVTHAGAAGIVLAVDLASLVTLAQRHAGLVEFLPRIGDFLAEDTPLFALHGPAAASEDRLLRQTVAVGVERTLEQDPMFALRILVDIALKALSPAINDPTTAVLALDQVHRVMRLLGRRDLRRNVICDATGTPRVVFRAPDWEDYVTVACREIRACGGNSLQVVRRMRAMLIDLHASVPLLRRALIARELQLLDATVDAAMPLPDDRRLAHRADVQGLGGAPPPGTASRP